jgi:ABC-2 type transport system ATP-binding protein
MGTAVSSNEGRSGVDGEAVAVRCQRLVKRYGALVAVDGLDLEVRRGECFGLLGPNGAGKTTTVEILEGLAAPDEGSVEVLGCRWGDGCDRELRQRFGVALQETRLADKLTVAETVRLFRSFYRRGHAVDEVIGLVELEDKRNARVGKLSGGQRQRLALACALVCDPEVLFLDEPTTGLDPQARHKVWEIVEDFRTRGGSVLLTTHYMEEAARLCDRVAIMDHGRIITLGTPAQLVASLGGEQIVEVAVQGALDRDTLAALPGVRAVAMRDGGAQVTVDDIALALRGLLDAVDRGGARLETLRTHQATLEDVFVQLTGRGLRDE